MGLTSRDGIVPLYLDRDVGGPMTRTVEDAVIVFDVIAGHDPADPWSEPGRRAGRYTDFLVADGLRGARIGVLRQLSNTETADPEVLQRFEEALADLRAVGAVVIDSVAVPELDTIEGTMWCRRFRHDIEAYLASLGLDAPVKTLEEIIESDRFHPPIEQRLRFFQGFDKPPEEDEGCQEATRNTAALRAGMLRVLEEHQLDAVIYPSWNNPPRLIGDLTTPHGNNSFKISPPTGFPAITVPMGFVRGNLPVGLQFLGDAWSEPTLIRLAYSYEQATRHRRPPDTTPPLGPIALP